MIAESMRRGLGIFMASVAGLTILSGLLLYAIWLNARGAAGMHDAAGAALTLGAAAGIIAALIGGAVLGRTVRELAVLAAASDSDAAQARIAALHQRGAAASKVVLALLLGALLLMIFSRSF